MIKSILSLSIFGLLGCAMFNPGICDRIHSDRYPECSNPETAENFSKTAVVKENSFRLNIYNTSWNTSRIYIHCAENDRRMDTMTNPIFSANTRQVIRLSGCYSIYLIVSGHGENRRSDYRSVVSREDVCAEVTQTMDIRWNVCSART
jgi:hypothetical protein